MHDETDTQENFTDAKPEKPNRSTGPTSPEGKARSSMNRLTHGCRSEKTVLPHEDPAEFDFTIQSWMEAYKLVGASCAPPDKDACNPEDPTAATLVYETAKAHWFFQRNQKRLDQIESRLPTDAWLWTPEYIQLYNNFLRYKTTTERSFYRAFNNLEAYYKRQADRAAQAEKARVEMARIQIKWLNKKAEAAAKQLQALQIVDVAANDAGDCVTTYAPTNDELASRASSENPPKFVSRYVFFNFGVPPAYDWMKPDHIQRRQRTVGVQQFLFSDWLKHAEKEKASGTGHLSPFDTTLILNP
jgi:hypothetical protein